MRAVVTSAAFELLLGAWVLGFALTSCAEQRSEPPLVIVDLYADRGCPHCAPATRVMERVAEAWSRDVQVRHHHLHLPSHRSEQSGTVEAASPRDAQVAGLLDVRAIPTIWVNGRRVLGPATFAAVAPLVRAELATAQMLVRSGTARPEVPAARARQNLGDPRRAGWLLGLEEPPENLPGTAPRTTAQPEPPSAIPDDARWAVPIDATSPTRGAADTSLVTIVLFEDLASPFCRRLQPTLEALLARHGDDVRLTYRHLPLPHNPEAKRLAFAAHCAHEQGQFWAMRDGLLAADTPAAQPLVASLGLDQQAFDTCLASRRPSLRVGADAVVARRVAVGGTPMLFVNGRKSAGALPLEELEALVEVERVGARALLAARNKPRKRSSLHDALTRHGRARAPLSPVPTSIAEVPAATLGAEASPFNVQAWLDLSDETQRRSLGMLVSAARSREDLRLAFFPARPAEGEETRAWQSAVWCAVAQGKIWELVDGVVSAVHATAAEHAEVDHAHGEGDHTGHAHGGVMRAPGSGSAGCEGLQFRSATFPGPTWLVNGRRYDGSMGWGPPALRRLLTLVSQGR